MDCTKREEKTKNNSVHSNDDVNVDSGRPRVVCHGQSKDYNNEQKEYGNNDEDIEEHDVHLIYDHEHTDDEDEEIRNNFHPPNDEDKKDALPAKISKCTHERCRCVCIMPECNRIIMFDDEVELQLHNRVLEQHPDTTDGPSVGLGWKYNVQKGTLCDQHHPVSWLNAQQRHEKLEEYGFTHEEMDEAIKEVHEIHFQRLESSKKGGSGNRVVAQRNAPRNSNIYRQPLKKGKSSTRFTYHETENTRNDSIELAKQTRANTAKNAQYSSSSLADENSEYNVGSASNNRALKSDHYYAVTVKANPKIVTDKKSTKKRLFFWKT